MKTLLYIVLIGLFLQSCDDGDVIINNFDFEEVTLEKCDNFDFVFFKIKDETNESLALQFATATNFIVPEFQDEFQLSGSDRVIYRRFNSAVGSDYFCNPIPPTTPTVSEELISTTGVITLTTQGITADSDGIPSELEEGLDGLQDTDGDELLDIIDDDDDGDNVPTFLEGVIITNGVINLELSRDTDGDGILDYLDEDDDGDGILTRNEDINGDLDPTNDFSNPTSTLADYLNPTSTNENIIEAYREHTYTFSEIVISINIENLSFVDQNGTPSVTIQSALFLGNFNETPNVSITETPNF